MSPGIQERIKKLIVDGRLAPGAALPTETELMSLLGVSRNSVREALKALQAMGIVEIRHGFGTYVGPMSLAPLVEGLSFRTVVGHYQGQDSLLELLELREAMETGLITRVVGRIPEEDLELLARLVDGMRVEAEGESVHAETDRAFHLALYRSLGNRLLSELLDAFWDAFHRVRTDLADRSQDPKLTWRQHHEILSAVRSGDAGRAEDAVRRHFDDIRKRLSSTAGACA
jgi:DNA-binding FadR family transcriptional regulator